MIRPEAKDFFWLWREVLIGTILTIVGFHWFFNSFGLLKWIGPALAVLGILLIFVGQQRSRFHVSRTGAGLVRIVESEINFISPKQSGSIAIPEITGITLITHENMRCWRLDQKAQTALIIPLGSLGGERLFDAFAEISGLSLERLLRQLAEKTDQSTIVWRRSDYRDNQTNLH